MKKIRSLLCKDIGIILCVMIYMCFYAAARTAMPYFDGAGWYFFSSLQRVIFGLAALAIYRKVFQKEKWTNVINFTHFGDGIRAGGGAILYILLFSIAIAAGTGAVIDTTFAILFSCLVCQQITTGFWEELVFRAFVLEGYSNKIKRNWLCRLAYACVSFIIFGAVHAIEYDNLGDAIDVFVATGIWGFVYAAVYLYSHNILVPMLLHFVYDIPANFQQFIAVWNEDSQLFSVLNDYVLTVAFIFMIAVSLVFVIKKPVYERQ